MKQPHDDAQVVMDMINQLADLNKIEDDDLMAGCFGVGLSLLFVYQEKRGLKKCQDMLCTMAELCWNRIQEAKKEMGVE